MMTKRVLGIDPSLTATGLCWIDIDEHNGFWAGEVSTVGAPPPGKDRSHRAMSRRVSALMELINNAVYNCDLIAIESMAYSAKGATAYVLPWVWGRVIDLAEHYSIPVLVVGTSQVKKYATGKGNADKDQVLAAAIRRFPGLKITNNNEGDAAIIASVGCRYLGFPIDGKPTLAQLDVMKKIEPAA